MRAIALGPSVSGKTVFIQSLIVDLMRARGGGSVFLHVYVWSPSIHMDPVWQTVKDFAKEVLKQNEEECFFEEFNPADLQGIIDKQQKLIETLKARGARTLPNILIVLDDIADNEQIARREVLLHQLFFRGRHAKISTLIATQKHRALAPQIRTQALSFCSSCTVSRSLTHYWTKCLPSVGASSWTPTTGRLPRSRTRSCTYAWTSPSRSFSNASTSCWSPRAS